MVVADGRRITYALDGDAVAGDLVRRQAEVAALRDISVLEPDIEDVVARPHAYLDSGARGAISTFATIDDVEAGLARLRGDLEDGTWKRRHDHLLRQSELDLGYRLVIARRAGEAEP